MKVLYLNILFFFFVVDIPGQKMNNVKSIVIIGIDALSPEGICRAKTPHMDELIRGGSYTLKAKAVLPTLSSPNWASMIMGVPPSQHEINDNQWSRNDIVENTYCNGDKGETFPTIYKVLRQKDKDADIALFLDWDEYARLVEDEVPTLISDGMNEDSTVLAACNYIARNQPVLTFIHLDNVDHAGHEYGHRSREYYSSVEKADSLLGVIIQTLETAGISDSTIILVTSDHGGKGKGHGGKSKREVFIPWIIKGPHIKAGAKIQEEVNIYDTAATIAYILGLAQPLCWIAVPIVSVFENYSNKFVTDTPNSGSKRN